jgi:N-acetylmuramoyl-L-alanine amidase
MSPGSILRLIAPLAPAARRAAAATALALAAVLVPAARDAAAEDRPVASGAPLTVTALRLWAAPTNTRVVFDLSAATAPVAPDSGSGRELVVTIPGEPVALAPSVPSFFAVADSAVDSVQIAVGPEGARFRVWFRDSTRFRVLVLPAAEDKPFRLVVDVARPGAAAAESRRLATIAASKRRDRVQVVAVDAGHGGEDPGARGRGVLEKNVTLAVARDLADELNRIPGVRAVLTRDGDYFIPLRERYRLAEKMKADLFISIHANSSRRRGSGNGSEVFFLSLRGASDQADADLADIENAADLVGGVPSQAEDDLVNILYDVKRAAALQRSQLLAETLLEELATDRRLESRGIKQAGFVVLKSVEFPSVLVEIAFLNNPAEARLLKNRDFQRQTARQLAGGVKLFFERARVGLGTGPTSGGGGTAR